MIILPFPSASGASGHNGTATDTELLQAFAKRGDSHAFNRLVERYISLVFGTACRRTQSRELAQEAAQNTFCQLARQAVRLKAGDSLAPWLHRVALREAGTLMRSERSRQRTLDRFAQSVGPHDSATASQSDQAIPGGVLSQAGEQLDEALASLREPERRAVILRYLQGLSLRELAHAESTSEEAVRKRVSRALDRLAALLARRGITATAMMGCLTPFPIRPAVSCSSIATRAAGNAAATAASPPATGVLGFAASWWPAAAVFLATAVPTAWLSGKAAGPTATNNPAAAGMTAPPASSGHEPGSGGQWAESERAQDLARLIGSPVKPEEREPDYYGYSLMDGKVFLPTYSGGGESHASAVSRAALRRAVLDLPLEEVRRVAAALQEKSGDPAAIGTLFARWADLDPEEAWKAAASRKGKAGYEQGCLAVLKEMARTDLQGALKWAKSNIPGQEKQLVLPLAITDPAAYIRIIESPLMKPEKPSVMGSPYYEILPADPDTALRGLREREIEGSLDSRHVLNLAQMGKLEPGQAGTLAAFAKSLPEDSGLRGNCLQAAAALLSFSDPARAAELWADSLASSGAAPDRTWRGNLIWLLREWHDHDPATASRWYLDKSADLPSLDPETQEAIAKEAGLNIPSITAEAPVSIP